MRNFISSCTGSVAVYFALLAPVLVGFAALGTEVGLWLLKERRLQHAADTAAYAAAVRSLSVTDFAMLESVAIQAANLPNSSISLAVSSDNYIVSISHSVPRQLTQVLKRNEPDTTILVRAVAKVFPELGDLVCMHALSTDPNKPAISVSGSGTVNIRECAFATNSPAPDSLRMEGANVQVSGACLYTVGGVHITSGLDLTDPKCEEAQTLSPPTPDPYKNLRMPNSSDVAHLTLRNSTASRLPNETLLDYTGLGVARFSSLILQNNVDLEAGLYIIDGGELQIRSNATLTGKGVSFYLMNGARLVVNGTPTLNISAYDRDNPALRPDDFAGLLFFSDREGSSISHSISGTASSTINGVFYFPNDNITFVGDAGTSFPCIQIIASQINISGNGSLNIGCMPDMPSNHRNTITTAVVRLIE